MSTQARATFEPRIRLWLGGLLVLLTGGVYSRVVFNDFLNFDDPFCVTENPHVLKGWSLEGIQWAFTTGHFANWAPLTWLSHMVDCQLFGVHPAGHHATSLVLHLVGVLFLYGFLVEATGAAGLSFTAAAIFALHPLHVESVAWIAERKGILSTALGMMTLYLYGRYARHPSWIRLCVCLTAYMLTLLSKQMLVTLPFLLFLLDDWPLRRLRVKETPDHSNAISNAAGPGWQRCALEKLPFAALAIGFSLVAYFAQSGGQAVSSLAELPLWYRFANAVVTPWIYLKTVFWPVGLAPFYPHPLDTIPGWQVAGALLFTSTVLVWIWRQRRHAPYAWVGGCWYGIALLPVLGLIPIGRHGRADRYTDIPLIGVYIAVVWTTSSLLDRLARKHRTRSANETTGLVLSKPWLSAGVVFVISGLTLVQLGRWRDSATLFAHAVAADPNNFMAHNQLASALLSQGRVDEAAHHFAMAQALDPTLPMASLGLGEALLKRGDVAGAAAAFQTAIDADPQSPHGYHRLGLVRMRQRDYAAAEALLRQAVQLDPSSAANQLNHAVALMHLQRFAEARRQLQPLVDRRPQDAMALRELGIAVAARGAVVEATDHLQRSLAAGMTPRAVAHRLVWLLTPPMSQPKDAIQRRMLAEFACAITERQDPLPLAALAHAQAATGAWNDAEGSLSAAIALAQTEGLRELAAQLERERDAVRRQVSGRP